MTTCAPLLAVNKDTIASHNESDVRSSMPFSFHVLLMGRVEVNADEDWTVTKLGARECLRRRIPELRTVLDHAGDSGYGFVKIMPKLIICELTVKIKWRTVVSNIYMYVCQCPARTWLPRKSRNEEGLSRW